MQNRTEAKWHKLCLTCEQCQTTPSILDICVAADGNVLVEMLCIQCSRHFAWVTDIAKMLCGAFEADQLQCYEDQLKEDDV